MIENMSELKYVVGDATVPQGDGNKIIAHICNNCGQWGGGFVVPLGKRYPVAKDSYKKWYQDGDDFGLGYTQFTWQDDELCVANMVAQDNTKQFYGPPIRYDALEKCLNDVAFLALTCEAIVHASYWDWFGRRELGCGRAVVTKMFGGCGCCRRCLRFTKSRG